MNEIATREERARLKSFQRFSAVPDYDNPAKNADATQEHPRFIVRPMRTGIEGLPDHDDLWAVVELSHRDRYIRNSSKLTVMERASLYTEWFYMFPLAFALLERFPADSHGASIIGNTAILPLLPESMDNVARGVLKVIDLTKRDLAPPGTDRVLLFDTWVLHGDYKWGQCGDPLIPERFRTCSHHGFGNALTLKHLGALWEPETPLRLYMEPSAQAMDRLMSRVGFSPASKSEHTKKLLFLNYEPGKPLTRHNALEHALTSEVIASLKKYRSWWVEEWPQKFRV